MKIIIQLVLATFLSFNINGQLAPDFTVTDTEGTVHQLYADHLNQGQTVVIELFFVSCPPCQGAAPSVEARYQDWGAGEYDVEFIKLTTQNSDDDDDVTWFKSTYGTTFPGISVEGGAEAARTPYRNGTFGPYYGTPQFSVVAPDGTVNHGVPLSGLSDAIAATGAQGMGTSGPDYTTYSLVYSTPSNTLPDNVEYLLSGEGSQQYNITQLTGGTNTFDYPSDLFPEVINPIVTIVPTGPAVTNSVRPPDLLLIVKHILETSLLDSPAKILAADATGDGEIKPADLLILKKLLLGLSTEFPNNTPSWKVIENEIPLVPNLGNTIELPFEIVKTGDVTF